MAKKISDLERERKALIGQLVTQSVEALDPSSELADLIAQLQYDSDAQRKEAVTGLFNLADSRALPSLMIYFDTQREEAISVMGLFEWYDLFWLLDFEAGLSFALSELESVDARRSGRAFEELQQQFVENSDDDFSGASQHLERIALTNTSSLVRTRAKILISASQGNVEQDSLTKLINSQRDPKRPQLIFSIFNRAGLSNKFPALVGDSEDLTYWKTGLFLLNSFLVDGANRNKYVSASEMLVELPMSKSSLGFNLYFLSKMEQFRGNSNRAKYWLDECQSQAPKVCHHLVSQDADYDLESVRNELLK